MKRRLGMLLSGFLFMVLIGCEDIGSMRMNDMLLKQLEVEQIEQSQKLEIEIDFNEEVLHRELEGEDPKLVELIASLSKITVNISHTKLDDAGNQLTTGDVTFGKGTIPFTVHVDQQYMRMDIGGLKRPIVLPMELINGDDLDQIGIDQESLTKELRKLVQAIAPYFIKGLPNPPVLNINQVTETINGVPVSLTKVHAELNGEQLGQLIGVYLDKLIADEEGFRQVLEQIVQWYEEIPEDMRESLGVPLPAEMLEDRDAFIEEGVTAFFQLLTELREEQKQAEEDELWQRIFDKGIRFVGDFYVDADLNIRKSAFELEIAPAIFAEEGSPVEAITIRSSLESWNVNGEVTVEPVVVPQHAITAISLDAFDQGYKFIRLLDDNSVLYDLLKNDLKIDDQSFELSDMWAFNYYVDENGVAYVPLRWTLEEFGAKIYYTGRKGEIRFYDGATNQTVYLKIGSDAAVVNGEAVELANAVVNVDGYAYVAADDLFHILGAEYSYSHRDYGFYSENVMNVTRDL